MIQFEHVFKQYGDSTVVKDFSLNIDEGEFFVLIGPSGSGKTTTLKMINQLIPHTEGKITIEGKAVSEYDLQKLRFNIGYVLQQIALFPNMSVEENITVVPEMKDWSKEKMKERVTELLSSVGLDPDNYRQRQISELSGGEQQRIGVIRALAADPDIILMDEPFSALDPISRSNLQQDVRTLQQKLKKTVVFVTHDMQEAITLGDRICVMNEGAIEQVGTAEDILKNPANEFVREFLHTGLPQYKERKTVQDLLDLGYYEEKDTLPNDHVDVSTSIEDLTLALSKTTSISVTGEKNNLVITQAHLVQYYADEVSASKEADVS